MHGTQCLGHDMAFATFSLLTVSQKVQSGSKGAEWEICLYVEKNSKAILLLEHPPSSKATFYGLWGIQTPQIPGGNRYSSCRLWWRTLLSLTFSYICAKPLEVLYWRDCKLGNQARQKKSCFRLPYFKQIESLWKLILCELQIPFHTRQNPERD